MASSTGAPLSAITWMDEASMPSIISMLSALSGMSPSVASLMKSSRLASRLAMASMCACGMDAVLDRKASARVSVNAP
jgi:hypothetical protein